MKRIFWKNWILIGTQMLGTWYKFGVEFYTVKTINGILKRPSEPKRSDLQDWCHNLCENVRQVDEV